MLVYPALFIQDGDYILEHLFQTFLKLLPKEKMFKKLLKKLQKF